MAEAAGCQLGGQRIPVRRLASDPWRSLGHCIHLWGADLTENSAEGPPEAVEAAERQADLRETGVASPSAAGSVEDGARGEGWSGRPLGEQPYATLWSGGGLCARGGEGVVA